MKNNRLTFVLIAPTVIVALTALTGCGTPTGTPAAERTITKTVTITPEPEPEPAPAKTKTVTKEVTPDACLRALEIAEEAFGHAGAGFGAVAELLDAATIGDTATMMDANSDLDSASTAMNPLVESYTNAANACRNH